MGSLESNEGPGSGCLDYRLRIVLWPHTSRNLDNGVASGQAAVASFILRRDWLVRTSLTCTVLMKVKKMV